MTAWRLLAAGLAYPDAAIRRRRVPSPAARRHLRTGPCVSTTVPVDSQVAANFVRRSLAGMYPGDSHCALRVWVQRRCGSTSRQLDPDRFGGQTGEIYPTNIPRVAACGGSRRHLAAWACLRRGQPPTHVTRGRRLSRWWWQVLGSNQRRLSRRFYSPILLFEAYAADLRLCHPRRDSERPPSAMRPWAPGFGVRAVRRPSVNRPRTATDQPTDGGGEGHGRGRWERSCQPLPPGFPA
jgi:hypothetical protein